MEVHSPMAIYLRPVLHSTSRVQYKVGRKKITVEARDLNGLRAGLNLVMRMLYMLEEVEIWLAKKS